MAGHSKLAATRWWRAEEHHRLDVLRAGLEAAYGAADRRLYGYERGLAMYSDKCEVVIGRNLTTPFAVDLNLVRTLALTARAHSVEYAPPRAQILTSGGDHEVRRRAEKLTKWTQAALSQASYDTLARGKVALRSAVLGTGLVKVSSRWGKLRCEAPKPWQVFTHEEDEEAEDIRTMYHLWREDRGVLAHLFPRHAKYLDRVTGDSLVPWSGVGPDEDHRVWVVEAWHLPSSPSAKDGRRVLAVEGRVLLDEPFRGPIPILALTWGEPIAGVWGTGIAGSCGALQTQIYKLSQRLQQAIDLTCNPRLLAPRASRPTPWPPTNEIGGITWYNGTQPPTWDVARAVSPEISAQIERLWAKGFQMEGISEMAAMAMRPAGVESGEALRVYADKTSGRLAAWSLGFQDLVVKTASLMIEEARVLAEADPEFEVVYEDDKRKATDRIPFADVDLEADSYTIRPYVVSSLPESAAGRAAVVQDMLNSGQISAKQAQNMVRNPDLEAEMQLERAQETRLHEVLDEMLFGSGTYTAPEPLDDLDLGRQLVRAYYAMARSSNVGPSRLAAARRWSAELVKLIEKRDQGAAGAAPPGMPPAPPDLPPGPVPPPDLAAPPLGAEGAPL